MSSSKHFSPSLAPRCTLSVQEDYPSLPKATSLPDHHKLELHSRNSPAFTYFQQIDVLQHFVCNARQIVGVEPEDAGEYVCLADNGRGIRPADARLTLTVDPPTRIPATIAEDPEGDLVSSLGTPVIINCYAYGYPKPSVSWYVLVDI